MDGAGAPLQIDGLWALVVGPTASTIDLGQTIFFTAGPTDETHGLFGRLDMGD